MKSKSRLQGFGPKHWKVEWSFTELGKKRLAGLVWGRCIDQHASVGRVMSEMPIDIK